MPHSRGAHVQGPAQALHRALFIRFLNRRVPRQALEAIFSGGNGGNSEGQPDGKEGRSM